MVYVKYVFTYDDLYGIIRFSNAALDTFGHY